MSVNLVDSLQTDLEAVIDKYRDQGVSVAETIGTIEIVKLNLWKETTEPEDE